MGTRPLLFGTVVADGRCDFYLRNARATVGHGNLLKYLFSLERELCRSMTTIFRFHISNILPKDVKGLKYFKALGPLLERLETMECYSCQVR